MEGSQWTVQVCCCGAFSRSREFIAGSIENAEKGVPC